MTASVALDGGAGRHQRGFPGVLVDGGVGVDVGVARAAGGDVFAQEVAQAAQATMCMRPWASSMSASEAAWARAAPARRARR
jgi:hypothetical protein